MLEEGRERSESEWSGLLEIVGEEEEVEVELDLELKGRKVRRGGGSWVGKRRFEEKREVAVVVVVGCEVWEEARESEISVSSLTREGRVRSEGERRRGSCSKDPQRNVIATTTQRTRASRIYRSLRLLCGRA